MEIPHTVTARPDTGLWNAKIGIWLFLASEVMLFGALFSSYIFLRMGADRPWPVAELDWHWGAINTAVLILSSVTVVLAWFNLKMRNYARYKIFMAITILCAVGFMGIKAWEYYGKFTHYQITLKDGSVVNGHYLESVIVYDDVSQVTIDFAAPGDPKLDFLEEMDPAPTFTNAAGTTVTLGDYVAVLKNADENRTVVLKSTTPFSVKLDRENVSSATEESASLHGGVTLVGTKTDDYVSVVADEIDLRMADDFDDSMLFAYLPDSVVADYHEHVEKETAAFAAELADPHGLISTSSEFDPQSLHFSKDGNYSAEGGRRILRMKLGEGSHAEAESSSGLHEEGGEHAEDTGHAAPGAGEEGQDAHAGSHSHPLVKVAYDDVRFYSNWGPKKNTYYSIYFTLTGLHGLHVIGGALVLSYMFFTGRQMYLREPEHLANRVEVGGLFWHFVDLIWIFLFPLLYLL